MHHIKEYNFQQENIFGLHPIFWSPHSLHITLLVLHPEKNPLWSWNHTSYTSLFCTLYTWNLYSMEWQALLYCHHRHSMEWEALSYCHHILWSSRRPCCIVITDILWSERSCYIVITDILWSDRPCYIVITYIVWSEMPCYIVITDNYLVKDHTHHHAHSPSCTILVQLYVMLIMIPCLANKQSPHMA